VKLNAGKHGNVSLHTITVDLPDSADESARDLFGGDKVNIVLGTAPKALYLAFGKDGEALLKKAIDASDQERRRIAGDLHDGVVQSLSGTAFSLAAAAERSNGGDGGSAREVLERGATQTRRSVRELRSLLVEIYPPSLRDAGLESALMDLLAPLGERGIATEMDIDVAPALPSETEGVLYRVAQEAVRNAVAHASPSAITLAVARVDDRAFLTVTDDGRGLPTEGTEPQSASGHFGIQLMRDLAADAGGELWIEPGPKSGTRVRLEVPAR
jgi:signal transduction histidine kinase